MGNLYVHFPFCRRKCAYCALYSKCGVPAEIRQTYVRSLADQLPKLLETFGTKGSDVRTVYFGGGSPALCDLSALFAACKACGIKADEFTVELHPQDVSDACLEHLRTGGVNRISMGVQSLDDTTLGKMGRGYRIADAEQAFRRIRHFFDNAGIDLILGYPGDPGVGWEQLTKWGLRHCSVYSLILEPESRLGRRIAENAAGGSNAGQRTHTQHREDEQTRKRLPSDDQVMDQIAHVSVFLAEIGLERYEISNYAVPGFECQHNLAVWRGEDYLGLGSGAFGRIGLKRTQNWGQTLGNWGQTPGNWGQTPVEKIEIVDSETDRKERTLFRLRTREGLDVRGYPEWGQTLKEFCRQGLLTQDGAIYRLTPRGTEVCDAILMELV